MIKKDTFDFYIKSVLLDFISTNLKNILEILMKMCYYIIYVETIANKELQFSCQNKYNPEE